MTPTVFSVSGSHPDAAVIAQAARILCDGGLVAFPTETVYGLAADATNTTAMEKLNRVKGRPPEKPYSIHIADAAQVQPFVTDIPPLARRLMEQFWPGPLTIVMPSKTGGSRPSGFPAEWPSVRQGRPRLVSAWRSLPPLSASSLVSTAFPLGEPGR